MALSKTVKREALVPLLEELESIRRDLVGKQGCKGLSTRVSSLVRSVSSLCGVSVQGLPVVSKSRRARGSRRCCTAQEVAADVSARVAMLSSIPRYEDRVDYPLGLELDYSDTVRLRVELRDTCDGCFLRGIRFRCTKARCSRSVRADHQDVKFVKF